VRVEVVYAGIDEQLSRFVELDSSGTIADAVEASGMLERCPDIDLAVNKVGIWGRLRPLDAPVTDGDRVEIYRLLKVDPKALRRRRAEG